MIRSKHFLTRCFYKSNRCFVRAKVLTIQNMNSRIKEMYLMDTNDPVYLRYKLLKQRLKQCPGSLPFDELLPANSGDMQASGYKPVTFLRQVASAALYPVLLKNEYLPDDVKCKVIEILKHHKSVGSYTEISGIEIIRIKLAEYLCKRDCGLLRHHNNVILNGGSTDGIRNILNLLHAPIDCKRPAVIIPSPSYPYGCIEELGFKLIPYELNEDNCWSSTTENMECAIKDAKEKYTLRAMVIINPSNPTGTVLKLQELQEIVNFAYKEKLVLIVDESFQRNIFERNKFHSITKVMADLGKPYSEMEVVSVFGLSKDIVGENGIRAGVMELQNFNKNIMQHFLKCISVDLGPSSIGQIMMYAFADHPVKGDPSYELWKQETESRFNSFTSKAKIIVNEINKIEGFSCPPVEGGFYAFPKICVPKKAVEEGKRKCYNPSTFYALNLLEETGVLVTPGDVFGKENNPHIRISILPPEEKMKTIFNKINIFNKNFFLKYAD